MNEAKMGSCRVCGAEGRVLHRHARSVTSESKTIDAPSELRSCDRCGLVHTTIALDLDAYYATHYDATLDGAEADEIVSTTDGAIVFRTDVDYGLFARHALTGLPKSASIFELGAGRGRILARLRREGFHDLTAYDVSERYRAPLARSVDEDRVYIGRRPAHRAYDLVCSFFALEHDARPIDSLRYLKARTRAGGRLYLMLPSYTTNVIDLACADHVSHFSGEMLEHLLDVLGFRVLVRDETSNIGSVVVLAENAGPARDDFASERLVAYAAATTRDYLAYAARLERLPGALPTGRRLYLYGAGFYATLASAALGGGRSIAGIFDANPNKHGTTKLGARVASPDAIAGDAHRDDCLVVCVNPVVAPQIKRRFEGSFHDVVTI